MRTTDDYVGGTEDMKRNALMRAAGSTMILVVSMAGCTGAAFRSHTAAVSDKDGQQAARSAALTEKALAKRDAAAALTNAEAAVAAKPDSADYRALLGRAYLANGRFASAETAFNDAMTLGNRDPRTIISLSLVRTAAGKSDSARALLADNMDVLPAGDYGLAIAMAGDAREGVRILSQAIQDPSATAKTRQNLAYAYALSGEWREARMMAEQDLPPIDAAKRVLAWAQTGEKGAETARIAAFVGVAPRGDDAGLPARLALAPTAPTGPDNPNAARTADAAPTRDVSLADAPAPVETAAAAPQANPYMAATDSMAAPAPAVKTIALPSEAARETAAAMTPTLRRIAWIKPVGPEEAGNWVVQLGAFGDAAVAKASWDRIAARNSAIGIFPVVHSTATVKGRFYHRLAVGGFSDRAAADRMCRTIRAQSGQCFVREGGAEVKASIWAAYKAKPAGAKPRQLASR
jgi:Flp pilus assembly protein TadD